MQYESPISCCSLVKVKVFLSTDDGNNDNNNDNNAGAMTIVLRTFVTANEFAHFKETS